MTIVSFNETLPNFKKGPPERRRLEQLGIPNPGPSSRGSTYYKTLLSCPREHALREVARMHPSAEREELTVGLLHHMALEAYYKVIYAHQQEILKHTTKRDDHFYWGGHKKGVTAAYASIEPILNEDGYQATYEVVDRILSAYFDMWDKQDRWEIIAIEETLEWHGRFSYTARIDLIVYDRKDGGMWIVEHKTARSLTDDLLDNYQLDWQILGQVWLVSRCIDPKKYPAFKGVYINLASKHKTPRLLRVPINPSPAHLNEFELNLHRWVAMRKAAEAAGWPKSLGHCAGYSRGYSACAYYSVCHDFPTHTIEDWARDNPPLGYHNADELQEGT